MEENKRVFKALQRLSKSLEELNDKSSHELSHWRELPDEVSTAYKIMVDGASLVKATSTKYTLVGKIDLEEGSKLSQDLLKGCELMSTGVLVVCNDNVGCAASARHHAKQAAWGVVATVLALMETFCNETALENKNLAAQKTGAVWETCATVEKVPKGNRAAVRRDLLTWCMECNETMTEFTDLIQEGPASEDGNKGTSWDDFCEGESDQYTAVEIPIAEASVALLKCSRGTINVALKACEAAGEQLVAESKAPLLQWISTLFDMARVVGEGVTDLGTLLYPPLEIEGDECELKQQMEKQKEAIVAVHNHIIDACPMGIQEPLSLPEDVTETSNKLRTAAHARYEQAQEAITAALQDR